jgi:hypothetical protein
MSIESVKRKFMSAGHPANIGEPALKRVPLADFANSNRRNKGKPTCARASDEVHDGVERALVGPVQVIYKKHDRVLTALDVQPRIELHRDVFE